MSFPLIDPSRFNHDPCDCPHCSCSCTDCTGGRDWILVGDKLLSDRAIMLPVAVMRPAPDPVHTIEIPDYLTDLLSEQYSDQPSDEWFDPRYLDALETLGYQVRPLAKPRPRSGGRTHGVLHNGAVVGLLMPLDDPTDTARKAA